jgi:hypothetical protein
MEVGTWILIMDIALMGVLVAFSIRALRLPNTFKHSRRLTELEVSLRTLIREAASTGATFNDELIARKQDLEKLLLELEQNGARLVSAKEASRYVLNDLAQIEERGRTLRQNLDDQVQAARNILGSFQTEVVERVSGDVPEAPSFRAAVSVQEREPSASLVPPLKQAQSALEEMVEKVVESSVPLGDVSQGGADRFEELTVIPEFKEHHL